MAIYKPSELKFFLEQLGIRPKKGLSQNFLIDGNVIRKIVATAAIEPGDIVLEIGPGPGALTQALLEAGAHVVAVEKDKILAESLNRLQTDDKRLSVYNEDIMDFPIRETLLPILNGRKAKLVANLPYHLTTPILLKLVQMQDVFSSLIVMVQQEVAERFTSSEGSKSYGSVTVYLNYHSTPHYAFIVSRNCFYPAPNVDSAIVLLNLKTPPVIDSPDLFFKMTRRAFEHRRKMLRASLKELYAPAEITQALVAIGLNPCARPEELSLNNFIALFNTLSHKA